MHVLDLMIDIRFQDLLDIVFLTVVAYYLYLWFQGTKALKALVGLMALGIAFTFARTWGLFLTTWMFQILWQVFIILLIILFQPEIRQVLERVNPFQRFNSVNENGGETWEKKLAEACFVMARRRIGALIIIEKGDRVQELVTGGISVQGDPGTELLLSIFNKESPLHDGAVVIRSRQITTVACYLPLSTTEGLPQEWGTRHRAALGLAERCDAWVLVVSEERGVVSLARGKKVLPVSSQEELSRLLHEVAAPLHPKETIWWKRIRSVAVHRWRLKLGTFLAVGLVWLLLAGQQDFEASFQVPVELVNTPQQLAVEELSKPMIKVTARGLRKDSSTINPKDVHIRLDLSRAVPGKRKFRISRDQVSLPNDRVDIVRIEPAELDLILRPAPTS